MQEEIWLDKERNLYLTPLTKEKIDEASRLCDKLVGEGFYSKEQLLSICEQEHQYFDLLYSGDELSGYSYVYTCTRESAPNWLSRDLPIFNELLADEHKRIGVFQSLGALARRHLAGATDLLANYIDNLLFVKCNASPIITLLWEQHGYIPSKKLAERHGYRYLLTIKEPWSDKIDVYCEHCDSRPCRCSGALYIKESSNAIS